jgi:hypothetical protein
MVRPLIPTLGIAGLFYSTFGRETEFLAAGSARVRETTHTILITPQFTFLCIHAEDVDPALLVDKRGS